MKKKRIYVCHTFYHAYITFLKELKIKEAEGDAWIPSATLVLSKMSNKFGDFSSRAMKSNIFESVIEFDEQRDTAFPELEKYSRDAGNVIINMINRSIKTSKFAKLQEAFVPVDFKEFEDVYVYCDTDPIGVYLNKHKIYYHSIEDGLNSLKNFDAARYDNRGFFAIKAFASKRLNLIVIQNGYGKYCIDMEVNDIHAIELPCPYYIEVPRKELSDRLTDDDKRILLSAFVADIDKLYEKIAESNNGKNAILVLSDPLCTLDVRERIFRDIIADYTKEGTVFLKPHPRDEMDYKTVFADVPQFEASVPMEMLNFFPNVKFKKVVGVLTEMKGIEFAEETVRLGPDFLDKYEAPEIHRQNENI